MKPSISSYGVCLAILATLPLAVLLIAAVSGYLAPAAGGAMGMLLCVSNLCKPPVPRLPPRQARAAREYYRSIGR